MRPFLEVGIISRHKRMGSGKMWAIWEQRLQVQSCERVTCPLICLTRTSMFCHCYLFLPLIKVIFGVFLLKTYFARGCNFVPPMYLTLYLHESVWDACVKVFDIPNPLDIQFNPQAFYTSAIFFFLLKTLLYDILTICLLGVWLV